VALLRELATRHPDDRFILRNLGHALRSKGETAEALATFQRAAALPGGDVIALFGESLVLQALSRFDEALKILDDIIKQRPDYIGARQQKISLYLYTLGDLERAKAELANIRPADLADERTAPMAAFVWYWARDTDKCLAAVKLIGADYIESNTVRLPKALLVGLAYRVAGKAAAADAAWTEAMRVLERRLAQPNANSEDHFTAGFLQAELGNVATAERELRLYEQLNQLPEGRPAADTWWLYTALGRRDAVLDFFEAQLHRASDPATQRRAATRWASILRYEPQLDLWREEPRFKTLLAEAETMLQRK
jgi:tetratricopeptide (TPR) repeat protein